MKIRHKWKRLKPAGRRELERKRCERCGIMVRRVRDGKFRDTETKVGCEPWISTIRTSYRVPDCKARVVCPTCGGRGTIDAEPSDG